MIQKRDWTEWHRKLEPALKKLRSSKALYFFGDCDMRDMRDFFLKRKEESKFLVNGLREWFKWTSPGYISSDGIYRWTSLLFLILIYRLHIVILWCQHRFDIGCFADIILRAVAIMIQFCSFSLFINSCFVKEKPMTIKWHVLFGFLYIILMDICSVNRGNVSIILQSSLSLNDYFSNVLIFIYIITRKCGC